ncbi:MAG: hypothetical protein ACPG7F_20150, partial [Aggregatilineales bacterium]
MHRALMSFQQFASIAQQLRATTTHTETLQVFLAWLEQSQLRAAILLAGQTIQRHDTGISPPLQNWLKETDGWQTAGYPEVLHDIMPEYPVLLLPLYYNGYQQGVLIIEDADDPSAYLLPAEMLMTRLDHLHHQSQMAACRRLIAVMRDYDTRHTLLTFFIQETARILDVDDVHIFDFLPGASQGTIWFIGDTGRLSKTRSGHQNYHHFQRLLQDEDLYLYPGTADTFLTSEVI